MQDTWAGPQPVTCNRKSKKGTGHEGESRLGENVVSWRNEKRRQAGILSGKPKGWGPLEGNPEPPLSLSDMIFFIVSNLRLLGSLVLTCYMPCSIHQVLSPDGSHHKFKSTWIVGDGVGVIRGKRSERLFASTSCIFLPHSSYLGKLAQIHGDRFTLNCLTAGVKDNFTLVKSYWYERRSADADVGEGSLWHSSASLWVQGLPSLCGTLPFALDLLLKPQAREQGVPIEETLLLRTVFDLYWFRFGAT